jgi:RimJ/RimL family protein N-acetyltransferase
MLHSMSASVTLRRIREDDLEILEKLTHEPKSTGEYAWFGWHEVLRWRHEWAQTRMLGPDGGAQLVVRGDDRLGFVTWRRRPATAAAYYWVIGVALLPAARGHGYGTQAQWLLARYLFAHTTAHRIEAATETANVAEQRALEKAGFSREGVSRGIGWRDGGWRDGVTYSLLRTDPAVAALGPGA